MHLLVLLSLIVSGPNLGDAHSFCNESGWETVFYEGFDTPVLNLSRWSVLNGTSEDDLICRGGEARCMASNVGINGGMLRITTQKEASGWAQYTTGGVVTRDKDIFEGPFRMCVFAQVPEAPRGTGAGYLPFLRLLPNDNSCLPDHGELDFMEQLNGNDTIYSTYRTAPAGAPVCTNTSTSEGGSIEELITFFNEFSIEVDADGVFTFIVNNDLVYINSTLPTQVVPWFLSMGFGIGGGRPEPPNSSTIFPAVMNVDWVQVVARTNK